MRNTTMLTRRLFAAAAVAAPIAATMISPAAAGKPEIFTGLVKARARQAMMLLRTSPRESR
jgi:hypothetical protein